MRKKTETTKTTRVLWLAMLALLLMTGNALRAQASDEVWDGSVASSFDGGSGTESDPYLISNGAQLAKLAQDVNGGNHYSGKYFKLTNDIWLNNTDGWRNWGANTSGLNKWTAIGYFDNNRIAFAGTFDGDGHTVRGLYINNNTEDKSQGLFGYIDYQATIKNLKIAESLVYSKYENVGAIVGYVYDSTISNCQNSGKVACTDRFVGGIVGKISSGSTITYCQNSGLVTCTGNCVGGIVGNCFGSDGVIDHCQNSGNVNGANGIGGIAGMSHGKVSYSFNTGSVSGNEVVGGICGELYMRDAVITSSFNTGKVSGSSAVGGVGGRLNSAGKVYSSYYLDTTCGKGIGSGSGEATKKTNDEFKSGEVCWLLNGGSTSGQNWYQTLASDGLPVLDNTHGTVYAKVWCPGKTEYANEGPAISNATHTDSNHDGVCEYCGQTLVELKEPALSGGVYQIGSAGELFWFSALVNGYLTGTQNTAADAVLTADITLVQTLSWTPIGSESNPYTGTFDGQGHTISGMTIENATGYSGLFGNVTGTVRNFTVDGTITINTTATDLKVGGAVGCLGTTSAAGTVSGVTSKVNITVTSGKGHIGGVVGSMIGDHEPKVENCLYTGNIKYSADADCVAGVVAYIRSGHILNCANRGTVSVNGTGGVGGILGYGNNKEIYIRSCYSTGNVTGSGTGTVGAIVGNNKNNQFRELTNCCYLTGSADKGQGQLGTDAAGTVVMSAGEFKSGAVCWLLNGSTVENVSWYQTLGQDELPVLDNTHGTVYQNGSSYSNIPPHDHEFSADGFCTVCNLYQSAVLADGRYEISNAGQLFWFAALVNGDNIHAEFAKQDLSANGVLNADIVIPEDMDWTPMAASAVFGNSASTVAETTDKSYSGVFDGAGHKISNLNIRANEKELTSGLFGAVTGTIKNLGIESAGFDNGGAYDGRFGAVCGLLVKDGQTTTEALVQNCFVINSSIKTKDKIAGAIVGANYGGTIANCYEYNNSIEGYKRIGNLVGDNQNDNKTTPMKGTVSNCYSNVKVVGDQSGTVENSGVKSADEFKSGAVAVLLQGDQTELAWGQTIGTDEYPVLTTDEAKRVYAAKLYNGSADKVSELYTNASGISLPEGNAILVIEDAVSASTGTNVVVKDGNVAYTCANLVLTDGADFYTPVTFTAGKATYSRTLPETSTWGTIVLPFAAETIEGASLYEATEIIADGSEESILAVQPLTGGALEANTPALFQGETAGTTLTFSASDAEVAATADAVLTKGYTLTGSLSTISALSEGDLFIARDKFWSVGTTNKVRMQAFRAYIDEPESAPARVNALRILVGDATSIRQALSDGTLPVDVYSLQGVQLRQNVARDAALEGLPAGIYIVGGKKVVKK